MCAGVGWGEPRVPEPSRSRVARGTATACWSERAPGCRCHRWQRPVGTGAGTATAVAGREAASGQHEAGCHLRGGEPVPGAAGSPPPLGTRSRGGSPRGQRCLRPGVWSFPREERGRGRQGSGPKASDLILPTILPTAQLAGGVPAGTQDLATSPPAPRLLITAEAPDGSKAA